MQIRTDQSSPEDVRITHAESKSISVSSDKAPHSGPNFMDLMKSIQLRSQQALEEGEGRSAFISDRRDVEPKEQDLFEGTGEVRNLQKNEEQKNEEEEEVASEEGDSDFSEIYSFLNLVSDSVSLSENQKGKLRTIQELDESATEGEDPRSEKDTEATEGEIPFHLSMSAFLQTLEPKKEDKNSKEEEGVVSLSTVKKNLRNSSKEEIHQQKEFKSESTEAIETPKSDEKKNVKEFRQNKPSERESLEEGMKKLDEVRKFSKPANEEKGQAILREVNKENVILDSESIKVTREKKSESYAQISKSSSVKLQAAEDAGTKSDSGGKDKQNQESFHRQGNETTLSLIKAGMGVADKDSASFEKSRAVSTRTSDPGVARENFQRLVQSARLHIVENGRSEATLRLNPQELGRVSLRISVEEDRVQGRILVESEEVKRMFSGDLEQLKKDFKDQGLVLESLSVEVEESGSFLFADKDSGNSGERRTEESSFSPESKTQDESENLSDSGSIEIPQNADKNTERRLNVLV
ncbi:flagellar hook-length control protein FliK [Leptospira fletcheri]|uniref:Flagellar hook-length control protein FliK n=1 Tax=Leptospira fletcheri TaxID=2484981 RepID=A0A4R9GI85_9LEPT|nr:flagellar hook-length control protein FliK [Leptospira fletcheri]TGK12482.1 flagellar hook-length control protein FliK [Leptospira fletcheri]